MGDGMTPNVLLQVLLWLLVLLASSLGDPAEFSTLTCSEVPLLSQKSAPLPDFFSVQSLFIKLLTLLRVVLDTRGTKIKKTQSHALKEGLDQGFPFLMPLTCGAGSFSVVRACPVHWRLFSGTSGLYPVSAGRILLPIMTTKNVCRHCQMSPVRQNWPPLRTTGLDAETSRNRERKISKWGRCKHKVQKWSVRNLNWWLGKYLYVHWWTGQESKASSHEIIKRQHKTAFS